MRLPNEANLFTTPSDTYLLRTALHLYIYLQCSPLSEITLKLDFFAKRVHGYAFTIGSSTSTFFQLQSAVQRAGRSEGSVATAGRTPRRVTAEEHMALSWLSK
ncbi:hypothetical protein JZ751_025447 [Albula glossodonta]|uniref:Uncharacterized protein n=1 Tax=Albula glossodonta TaxID=121402 RepID=A0A8T2NEA9_9TELE|nr:hypothetical protein JZ751_025447 [Albula glossodonta]